jgi:hypothetical protein
MTAETVVITCMFGLVTGMRHACEPDHVAAMSTLVAEGHGSRRTAWLGAWWGLGHASALLAAGVGLGALRAELSSSTAQALELLVALMLMGLGVRAIRRGLADMRHGRDSWHTHGHTAHHHPARGPHLHVGAWALSPRAYLVGIVHGLAGSGALAVLAMGEFTSLSARLVFVALFGLGSVAAMAALSGLAGWQLSRIAARPHLHAWLQLSAGLLSLVVGVLWALPALAG